MTDKISIFWFRRDLRLDDNAGLYYALRAGHNVQPVFIFDTNILDELEEKADRRISFIHHYLQEIQTQLLALGSTLQVLYCSPIQAFEQLTGTHDITAVYTNHDYEPYARQRDKEVSEYLLQKNIPLYTYKDQVVFEKNEIVKDNNEPYTVFTPYSKKWKLKLNDFYLKPYPTEKYFGNFRSVNPLPIPSPEEIGFKKTGYQSAGTILNEAIAISYDKTRDYPGINGTTRLRAHLRFGTIIIRILAAHVKVLNETLLNELIWREFYQMILWNYPHVVNTAFKKEYDNIQWRNNEDEFKQWCDGNTGYPIVDAGMRELNETGYMHNRVRMVVASFLTKHLLIDWRWGESYFAAKLMDYELAANNGGWQWASGSGCDAAPYFRVFNPYLQTDKFDPELNYIKKWVPEYDKPSYPKPIVEHSYARTRCLAVYKEALNKNK